MSQELLYWHKVEAFIGRDQVLYGVLEKLQDEKTHLVAISGGYGYGKTRLLLEILKKAKRQNKQAALPVGVIDLYKTEYHSAEGLAQAIVESLPREDVYFSAYINKKRERDEARLAGNARGVQKANQEMLAACENGLVEISQNHGLLLLLDTAERWVYPSLEGTPFTQSVAPAVAWFKDVCAALPQGVIILAGREPIEKIGFANSESIRLERFSFDETRQYVRKVALKCQRELNRPFTFSTKEVELLQRLSAGRPILLALYLERLAHGDERIRNATAFVSHQEFEPLLIKHLMQDPQIGKVLRIAGRALRGIDEELLEEMSKTPSEDPSKGEELSESERNELKRGFEILQGMSFAKRFHGSPRTFLHDEMYEMLARNVYQKGDDLEADQSVMGLYRYYKKHTEALNREIGALYRKYAETEKDNEKKKLWTKIETTARELQSFDIDFSFYRWQRVIKRNEDPLEMGLRRYYRLAHEAATSNDWESLVLLRFELIRQIKKMQGKEKNGQPQPWLPFLWSFLFVQEIWERHALGKTQGVSEEIEKRLSELQVIPGLLPEQKIVSDGLLKVWRGMFLLYAREPDYRAAKCELEEGIQQLQEIQEHTQLHWLASSALSLAHRQSAYLHKKQGLLNAATEDYRQASLANRWLDYNYEEATIRSDLGDTQVLIGALDDAYLNLQDAFKLRQRMKNGARLALSYSTLSRYFTADGAYEDARIHAERGVNLSSMVGRGTAFARLSLAEALRRYATQKLEGDPQGQNDLLSQAERTALDALPGLSEPVLTIEVKLELGCIYRDRLRTVSGEQSELDFTKSNELLLEAKQLAASQKPPIEIRMADAMANRVWLGLFARKGDFTRQAAAEFKQLGIFGFDLDETGAFSREIETLEVDQGKRPLLPFIGKYHAGLGALALGRDRKLDLDKAPEVARRWMLGLEYSARFAARYRGLSAARNAIHKSIKVFNRQELAWLTRAVLQVEEDEQIPDSLLKKLMQQNSYWVED